VKRINFAIAVLAALVSAYQTQISLLGFAWAVNHGVGLLAVVPLWPLLSAQAVLWIGYAALRQQTAVFFTLFAVAVILLTEALMPRTPLKDMRQRSAISRVEVRNIRDDPYRAASGEQIGIRITFEAVFAESGEYFVGPTALSREDPETVYELGIASGRPMPPSPAPRRGRAADAFDAGVVYAFAFDLRPHIIEYDPPNPPCIRFEPRLTFSESDLLNALSRNTPTHYTTTIEVSTAESGDRFSAATYVTANKYHVQAMYQSVMSGSGRCKPRPLR